MEGLSERATIPTTEPPPALAKLRRTFGDSQALITHAPQAGDLHALVPALEG